MKLYFIKSAAPAGYAYLAEQVYEIDENLSQKFIRQRLAVPCPEKFTKIPSDFPYRKMYIDRGVISWEQLQSLEPSHSLGFFQGVDYGFKYPLTKKLLKEYQEKNNKPKNRNFIY